MAPAAPGRCRMGACETTPPATHSPGNQQAATSTPTSHNPRQGPSSLPMIGHRWPASGSFALARSFLTGCGRSSWTPARATAQTSSDEESHNNSHASPVAPSKSPGQATTPS